MPWIQTTQPCIDCGTPTPVRSFRVIRCPTCIRAARRDEFGCLLLAPVALAAAFGFGWIGLQLGRLLALQVPIARFDVLLAMLLGFDAFAAVASVRMRFAIKMSYVQCCLCLCLMYFLIGMKTCRGLGVATALVVGLSNCVLMLPFVLWVAPRDPTEVRETEQKSGIT